MQAQRLRVPLVTVSFSALFVSAYSLGGAASVLHSALQVINHALTPEILIGSD